MAINSETVVTKYTGEASQLMAELEKIRAGQAKLGQSVDGVNKSLQNQNKDMEASIAKWAKIGVGIAAAKQAFDFATEAVDLFAKSAKYAHAAGSISIDGLRTATAGLYTQMDLLKFAAEANNGVMKLSQKETEALAGSMRALVQEGEDENEVLEAFTNFMGSGKARGLEKFGIFVDDAKGRTEKYNAVLGQLTEKYGKVSGSSLTASEAIKHASVQIEDAFSGIKIAIGQMVAKLAPAIELLGAGIARLAKFIDMLPGLGSGSKGVADSITAYGVNAAGALATGGRTGGSLTGNNLGRLVDKYNLGDLGEEVVERKRRGGGAALPNGRAADASAAAAKAIADWIVDLAEKKAGLQTSIESTVGQNVASVQGSLTAGSEDFAAFEEAFNAQAVAQQAMSDAAAYGEATSKMESIFGPLEEIDMYTESFQMLEGAVSAGFGAWIDGSESAGAAMKKFVAGSLKNWALEMAVQSVRNLAYGFSALANPVTAPTAGGYFVAAAKFAAGAALAGGAAKALGGGGGGGGSSASSSSSAAPVGGSTGASGGGTSNVTVVIGDSFADDSPRMRTRKAYEAVRRGLAAGAAEGNRFN